MVQVRKRECCKTLQIQLPITELLMVMLTGETSSVQDTNLYPKLNTKINKDILADQFNMFIVLESGNYKDRCVING